MKIRTNVKAGGLNYNHNEMLIRGAEGKDSRQGGWYDLDSQSSLQHNETLAISKGLKVRTHVRAGGSSLQHNEALVREASSKGVMVRTHLRAGGQLPPGMNHNETLVRKA